VQSESILNVDGSETGFSAEAMQLGTVERERHKRQRRAAMEYWREVSGRLSPLPAEGLIVRLFKALFRIR
jgi:hypothetical protein